MVTSYAQIDKVTGKIINTISVSNGYVFDGNYNWAECEQYGASIGCFYIDNIFYKSDKITVMERLPTLDEKVTTLNIETKENKQDTILAEQNITDLELQNIELGQAMTDLELLVLSKGV